MTAVAPDRTTGVHFGLVELDLLATHAGTRFPFPLRVREFGRIDGEREVLLAAAGVTLRARGLAGERGPLGIAAEVVTALREYRGSVDLVLAAPGAVTGIAAVVYRSWALICKQVITGDRAADGMWIRRIAQTAIADELAAMVPAAESVVTMPFTFPPDGAEPGLLDELTILLPVGGGAGPRGGGWLDGPRGRVRVRRAADGWTSVNTLRHHEMRRAFDDLMMIARRENNGS
jgi:hypothetical protein